MKCVLELRKAMHSRILVTQFHLHLLPLLPQLPLRGPYGSQRLGPCGSQIEGQPRKVSMAEAETRRQEQRCLARQQAAKTLKQCREESGDEFFKPQNYLKAGEEDGQ